MPALAFLGSTIVEETAISIVDDGIPEHSRTMTLEKVFWSHLSPNLCAGSWIIGILVSAAGLDFWWGTLAVVVGNTIGTIPTAVLALIGPQPGLTQIESSRFAFGRVGTRLPAVFIITGSRALDRVAVGNVIGTLSLVGGCALLGVSTPF